MVVLPSTLLKVRGPGRNDAMWYLIPLPHLMHPTLHPPTQVLLFGSTEPNFMPGACIKYASIEQGALTEGLSRQPPRHLNPPPHLYITSSLA